MYYWFKNKLLFVLLSNGSHHRNTYYKGFEAGLIQCTFHLHRLFCDDLLLLLSSSSSSSYMMSFIDVFVIFDSVFFMQHRLVYYVRPCRNLHA